MPSKPFKLHGRVIHWNQLKFALALNAVRFYFHNVKLQFKVITKVKIFEILIIIWIEMFRTKLNKTRKVCDSYSNTFNVFNVILFLVTPDRESLTHPHSLYYSNELWICIVLVKPLSIVWYLTSLRQSWFGGWENPGCGGLNRGTRGSQMGDGISARRPFSVALLKIVNTIVYTQYSIVYYIYQFYFFSSAYDVRLRQKVAVKKLSRPFQSLIHSRRTYRELRLLKHMKHENVRSHKHKCS